MRYEKRKIKYVQKTSFPWHNVFRQRGEICLKSIILDVNHCVALRCYVTIYVSLRECLFDFWSAPSYSRIFHSYVDATIAGEGLQILTYARHQWQLSCEGSLPCHTYCDTGHPFKMVISEDPWHSHLLPSVWQCSCHYLLYRLRSVATGDRTPISRTRGDRSCSWPPRRLRCVNVEKAELFKGNCWHC